MSAEGRQKRAGSTKEYSDDLLAPLIQVFKNSASRTNTLLADSRLCTSDGINRDFPIHTDPTHIQNTATPTSAKEYRSQGHGARTLLDSNPPTQATTTSHREEQMLVLVLVLVLVPVPVLREA
ncbi:hypothetical protein OPT61_g1996 [Boeremia exigua]|uniref:Uncharacterized protein n=1 Tax=Boeremia exigua TaxID=749465 RepID=A0ACC2IN47_9PLEO|nr:hypothetical protein OPT61_g1996 [Boeremia exigua]